MISRTCGVTAPFGQTDRVATSAGIAATTTRYPERNATLDLLRLLAAYVIVLFHAKSPGAQFMPAAMAIFAGALGYLAMGYRGDDALAAIVRKRTLRLIRPLLIWGSIYASMQVVDAVQSHEPVLQTLIAWLPPQGTMGALWFLPFAFAASLAIAVARRAVPAIATPTVAVPLAGVVSLLWIWMLDATQPAPSIAVYLDYVPAVFFGVALGTAARNSSLLVLTGAAALAIGLGFRLAGIGGTMPLELGIPLLTCALLLPRPSTGLTLTAAALSMAVYLIHILVLTLSLRLLPFPVGSLDLGLVGICVSSALGLLLIRTVIGRWII